MIACDVDESTLLDYVLADLDEATADALEEHLFQCAYCASRAERLARVVDGLRAWGAGLPLIATPAMIAQHTTEGRVQTIELGAFETREELVRSDIDVVVVKVPLDLSTIERVDVEAYGASDTPFAEVLDAPFDRTSGAVFATCSRDLAASNPRFRLRIRGRRAGVEVELADCACTQTRT